MSEELKALILKELERDYVLIKKGSVYYFLGGIVGTAISIAGLSFFSARIAIETGVGKTATEEILVLRNKAEEYKKELEKMLSSAPKLLASVPDLERKMSAAESSIGELVELSPINAARSVCYSALLSGYKADNYDGNRGLSIIAVPLPDSMADLDAVCHSIGSTWHAGGVAKGRHFTQNCSKPLDNKQYGGGYTSYVTEAYFEKNRSIFRACGKDNAYVCCSLDFQN